jgi:hypothetical protein
MKQIQSCAKEVHTTLQLSGLHIHHIIVTLQSSCVALQVVYGQYYGHLQRKRVAPILLAVGGADTPD